MSIIVVEGVDASGKSTLLENARIAIKRRYFTIIRHSCRPLVLSDALSFMKTIEGHRGDIVVDRHPLISEPIYGPLLRGGHLFSHWSSMVIDDAIRKTVRRVIYCRPGNTTIQENIDKQPQLAGVKEKLPQLIDAYDHRMRQLEAMRIPVMWYDYKHCATELSTLFFGDEA